MKMMPINSFKRKGRLTPNSTRLGKSKFCPEKNMLNDGIYGNSKLMYTAASLLGCVVQIQVRNGAIFEGVLRTFSHQLDVVLEMAHKVDSKSSSPMKGISPIVSNLLDSYPFEGGIFDKLIFKLSDIILMVASTVDMDYAVKDSFTDAAITKFNGRVKERELEPWEDAESDSEETLELSIEDEENGWDANDMFRTNAEKYGVKSSYDHSLQDYTVPLLKKDTEEYKLQEAKAMRIAQEIETNNAYQSRMQLEDGDEEERFSAVLRPIDDPSKYVLPQKRYNTCGLKRQPLHPCTIPSQSLLSALDEIGAPTATVPNTGAGRENSKSPFECSETSSKTVYSTQTLPPRIERRRESEKKFSKHKGRTDEIEEFKKFSTNFKLTDEKEPPETSEARVEVSDKDEDLDPSAKVIKFSTLNPNAKEFVFNPNAKSFTPRSMSVVMPPAVPPEQMMTPSQMIPPQPIFTAMAPPQYMMQGTPVSVAITSPFATGTPPPPAPRFRKNAGQPLLAPSGIPTPPQLTVQYSSPPGVMHGSAPVQPNVGYPQMNFVVGPRVMSPHPVSYCDTSHLPTHLIMSTHPSAPHTTANSPHTLHQGSNHHPPPPQCPAPVIHPSPSPVHSQPPTSSTVMYPGLQAMAGSHSHSHPMHPGAYSPHQPLVLMQQQQPVHMHPPHLLPQMAIIPTSAATSTPPFIQHP